MHNKIFIRLKNIFGSWQAGVFCLCVAITNKCVIAWFYASLKSDKSLYLLFAQSFLKTGILAEPVRLIETGTTNYLYDPAVHSPLYSFICAPVLWVTGSYFYTQFIVSCLSWIFFFAALYRVSLLVFKERWLVHLFILMAAFFLYPQELSSAPKDTWAAALTLWSTFFGYRFIISSKPDWRTTVLLSVMLAGMALIKLLYIPLAAAIVGIVLAYAFVQRTRAYLIQTAVLVTMLTIIGSIIVLFVLHPAYELAATTGVRLPSNKEILIKEFNLSNLLLGSPLISAAFINIQLWAVQLERFSISYSQSVRMFLLLDGILLVALAALLLVFFKKLFTKVMLFLVTASLVMIVVVTYLTVTQRLIQPPYGAWVFGSDTRSFLIPMLTLQLLAFLFVFRFNTFSLLRYVLLVLFTITTLHGFYFTCKSALVKDATPEANVYNDALKKVTMYVNKQKAYSNLSVVTPDKALRRYLQVQNIRVFSFSNLAPSLQWMKTGENFLIATLPSDSLLLQKFPASGLSKLDTIPPFVIHQYTAK